MVSAAMLERRQHWTVTAFEVAQGRRASTSVWTHRRRDNFVGFAYSWPKCTDNGTLVFNIVSWRRKAVAGIGEAANYEFSIALRQNSQQEPKMRKTRPRPLGSTSPCRWSHTA